MVTYLSQDCHLNTFIFTFFSSLSHDVLLSVDHWSFHCASGDGKIFSHTNWPGQIIFSTSEIDISADMLLKLETKSFCWKRDESNKKVFGLIAQDVQKIYPDLIANGGDFLRIDYMQLIPLLIHKIQNMDNDMNKIKRTMKHMQAQMDMIVSKLNI